MDYLTVKEAAEKWNLGTRMVTFYCSEGRIPGAKKRGNLWLIPKESRRPNDRRRRGVPAVSQAPPWDYQDLIQAAVIPMPFHDPDSILDTIEDRRLRSIYEAYLAYLRGHFEEAREVFQQLDGYPPARLCACPVAIVAAISLGDYRTYNQIEDFLKHCIEAHPASEIAAVAEHSLATATVSVIAPLMAPDWIKTGDLSPLPPPIRPNALYLRAKYLQSTGQTDAMLAVAQTAMALTSRDQGFTPTDLYLHLTCAVACQFLGRVEEAEKCLMEAMELGLPHGFITPFAEVVTAMGGLIEDCLNQAFPDYYQPVMEQWQRTFKNWISFHNQFTNDNITLMLTLREYHIALLAAHRVPYAEIARQHGISVGRLKNIMLEIYQKLFISSRDELAQYVF